MNIFKKTIKGRSLVDGQVILNELVASTKKYLKNRLKFQDGF